MNIAQLLIAPTIFFTALCLFMRAPQRRARALMTVGLRLSPRAVTALSVIGMVFGLPLLLKRLAEHRFAGGIQRK